jgi:hypothetical protein
MQAKKLKIPRGRLHAGSSPAIGTSGTPLLDKKGDK